jgi:hypothetical protein
MLMSKRCLAQSLALSYQHAGKRHFLIIILIYGYKMTEHVKVTMILTKEDVDNADDISKLSGANSKANAVSISLSLAKFIFNAVADKPGANLLIQYPDGNIDRVLIPALEHEEPPPDAPNPPRKLAKPYLRIVP